MVRVVIIIVDTRLMIVGWCGEVTVGTSGELDLVRMMIMKMNTNQLSLYSLQST